MRLVVLDTNVVVSAGIRRHSAPAQIVDAALDGAIQVAVSPSIVAEYRRVFLYSKFAQYEFPPRWLEFLIEGALRFPDGEPWAYPLPDPDDGIFLSLADRGLVDHWEFETLSGGVAGWRGGLRAGGVCGDARRASLIILNRCVGRLARRRPSPENIGVTL